MDKLKIVKGNTFETVIEIRAYRYNGEEIPDFSLYDCTDIIVNSRINGEYKKIRQYEILDAKTMQIRWEGKKMKVGGYSLEVTGKLDEDDWRFYSKTPIFYIVNTNEEAHVPVHSIIREDCYSVDKQKLYIIAPKGDKGDKGDTGAQGPRGLLGERGPQGPEGPQGPLGDRGPQGELGVQGTPGQNGSPGPQGEQGPQGLQGLPGPQGPVGPAGPQGPEGPQGAAGKPMASIYGNNNLRDWASDFIFNNTSGKTSCLITGDFGYNWTIIDGGISHDYQGTVHAGDVVTVDASNTQDLVVSYNIIGQDDVLATVASTGDYNDLINKPTVPTKTSDLSNDSGFLTSHQSLSNYYTKSQVDTGFLQKGYERGYEYVDLGLPSGTLWATMNIGATDETEVGNNYVYGGAGKTYDQLKYDTGSESFPDISYVYTPEKAYGELDLSLDTARILWGESWRMPSRSHFLELAHNTTFEYTNDYKSSGVSGYTCTAQNGNSIFFPEGNFGLELLTSSVRANKPHCLEVTSTQNPIEQNDISFVETNVAPIRPIIGPAYVNEYVNSLYDDGIDVWNKDTVAPNVVDYNGHQYVNFYLPSGTMWAVCNVGASVDTDPGTYFGFGYASGYTKSQIENGDYDQDVYNYAYVSSSSFYSIDTEHDAARAIMGGSWQIPTANQFRELLTSPRVNHLWTTKNGVNGILFTSTLTGNNAELFIPAAGNSSDKTSITNFNQWGFYHTKEITSATGYENIFLFSEDYRLIDDHSCVITPVRGVVNINDIQLHKVSATGNYNDLVNKPDLSTYIQTDNTPGLIKNDGTIDTNTYLTLHLSLSGYVLTSNTPGLLKNDGTVDTNTYLTSVPNTCVTSTTTGLKIEVVAALPASPDANTIYIVQ